MKRKIPELALSLAVVGCAMVSSGGSLRIAQIDLARQMEPLSALSNWVDRCQSYGYNAIQLYVEGRIGTKTFSLPKGECYPAEEMAELVKYATDKGLTVIPCVGLLGHADLFFKHPGNEEMNETREGNPRLGKGSDAFCISHPKTRAFLRQYVAEIAAIFPGPYFNAGLDEAWNAGVCSLCAPKEKKDELFLETILFCHEIITAAGKRMWMWDDFFDFHPKALERTPRDIVICYWNYNTEISSRGGRGHFAGLLRQDYLERFASLGFETIPACWYKAGNAEALYTYAKRYPTMGFMVTQWEEMHGVFPGGSLPRLAAAGLMLGNPDVYPARDPYPDAVRKVLPSLNEAEVAAAVTLYHGDGAAATELALQVLKASALKPYEGEVPEDQFSERGVLDDLVCRGEAAFVAARIARVSETFAEVRRTPDEIRSAKAVLRPLVPALEKLVARRTAQMDAWRPGCSPRSAASGPEGSLKRVKELLARPETPAPANEKRLEVVLVLPEYYGMPKWEVFGRFGAEWRKLAGGIWKPNPAKDWATFSKFFTFTSETMPTELRIENHGYGRSQLAFVAVEDSRERVVPTKVLSVVGDVEHAERLLADDYDWADFGTCGFLEKFFDAEKEAKVSSVTLEMSSAAQMSAKAGKRNDDTGAQVLFAAKKSGSLAKVEDLPKACRPVWTVKGESPSLLPDGHKFRLVWHDEFNGTRLDESKWCYRTNFWGRRFEAFAAPEDGCVEVKDGKVHLKLGKRADGHFCSPQLQTGELLWDYPAVENRKGFWPIGKRQKPKFVHRYGYYESRFRLQRRPGWWSAFWMQSETNGTCLDPARAGIEHDIMESFYPGCVGRHMFHMNGYGADYVGYSIPSNTNHTLDMSTDEYHTFGLLWEPDGYTIFVDGRRDGEKRGIATGDAVSHVPEFILISTECQWYRNNRMTGKAVDELEESARLGDDFVVDYVRVYDIVP